MILDLDVMTDNEFGMKIRFTSGYCIFEKRTEKFILQNRDKLHQQYTYMQKPDMYMHTHWYSKVEGVAYGL